jgi:subtilase family serine protease
MTGGNVHAVRSISLMPFDLIVSGIDNSGRTGISSIDFFNFRGAGTMARSFLGSAVAVIAFAAAGSAAAAAQTVPGPEGTDIRAMSPSVAAEAVEFDLFFPSRDAAGLDRLLEDQQTPGTADYQRWLTPEEFAGRFGADPVILAQAAAIMNKAGFDLVETHTQGIRVAGTVGAMQRRFGVTLDHAGPADGKDSLIARDSFIMPEELRRLGARIAAFAPVRKQIHSQRLPHAVPENRTSSVGGYWFSDLKQAYDAPSVQSLAGAGRIIGILMASDVLDSDMELYFGHEGVAEPTLIHIPVHGGGGFSAAGADSGEATLDVQQSGGMAPKAIIRLYNIPSLSDADVMSGLKQILADNATDVVSMSFGECELLFTAAFNNGVDFTSIVQIYEQLFQQGNAQGITFVASSGDNGALQCPSLSKPAFAEGASHPATSPEVTAVGGTNLVTSFTPGSLNSAYVAENANGDPLVPNNPFTGTPPLAGGFWGSGGGPSIFFAKPAYQIVTTGTAARATPDLSLHMGGCPSTAAPPCGPNRSFDIEIIGGQTVGVIGTSASAPAFAGVVALYDQLTGTRHGNINPMIYRLAAAQGTKSGGVYRRFIPGFNGLFSSGQPVAVPGIVVPTLPAYNMVVGAGSVDIRQFLGVPNLPAAGIPGTPSNP